MHDVQVDGRRRSFEVEAEQLDGALRRLPASVSGRLAWTPPTLEELFLRHYGEELAQLAAAGDDR